MVTAVPVYLIRTLSFLIILSCPRDFPSDVSNKQLGDWVKDGAMGAQLIAILNKLSVLSSLWVSPGKPILE